MNPNGRSVFITGGGSGLGAAVARKLAREGWRVALAGRRQVPLTQLADELRAAGADVTVYALDVIDAAAVEQALRAFKPDAMVCCAAILGQGTVFETLTPARFVEVHAINVGGTFNACSAAMRLWRETGVQGDIVTVSSLGGIRGMQKFPGFAAYASSKHAVVGLTEALAIEGRAHSIRINCIAPGTMRTSMTEALGISPSTFPDQIAPTVEFLLNRTLSGVVTGTTVEVHCNDD